MRTRKRLLRMLYDGIRGIKVCESSAAVCVTIESVMEINVCDEQGTSLLGEQTTMNETITKWVKEKYNVMYTTEVLTRHTNKMWSTLYNTCFNLWEK